MKKHHEVVCAVIKKDNKIFICQRNEYGECAYKWEFPGGKIEDGETHHQCLIREVHEELKSLVRPIDYITTVNYEYNSFILTMHAYLCELVVGNLELSEHLDSKWIDILDYQSYDFAPADKPILEKLLLI